MPDEELGSSPRRAQCLLSSFLHFFCNGETYFHPLHGMGPHLFHFFSALSISIPCYSHFASSLVFGWGALWSSGTNLQDLGSSTRDQTSAPYSGSSVLTARPSGNSLVLLSRSVFKHAQVCPVSIPEFHLPSWVVLPLLSFVLRLLCTCICLPGGHEGEESCKTYRKQLTR